jgi:hypothetical protein
MNRLQVTYKAPKGDSKVTEVFGYTFFDGKPETITVDDRVLAKLQAHPLFVCGDVTSDQPQAATAKDDKPPPTPPPPPNKKEGASKPARFQDEGED